MSHINTANGRGVALLVTDWGEWPCPPDLLRLWNQAPKRCHPTHSADGGLRIYTVVDAYQPDGRAYLQRESELIRAIDLIESTPGLRVVAEAEKAVA